jgi:hypothetical protein
MFEDIAGLSELLCGLMNIKRQCEEQNVAFFSSSGAAGVLTA